MHQTFSELFQVLSITFASIILSFVLAFPVISFLYKMKVVRKLDVDFSALIESRKQKYGTPIMGGLFIIISVLIVTLISNFNEFTLIPLMIFVLTAILGGLDDAMNIFGAKRKMRGVVRTLKLIRVHKNLLSRLKLIAALPWIVYLRFTRIFESNPGSGLLAGEKLLVQLILGAVLGYWLHTAGFLADPSFLWLPFLGGIDLGWLMVPFVVLTFGATTNAVNITDGLDGLAGGILLFSYIGFAVISGISGRPEFALLCATVAGCLISYLYFNIPPARVQIGDVGAFSLGALLVVIAFALGKPILLLVIGLPFALELMSSVVQSIYRRVFGMRLLQMAPWHHHLEMSGWSEEKVVMRFWLFSIVCTIIGIWFYFF